MRRVAIPWTTVYCTSPTEVFIPATPFMSAMEIDKLRLSFELISRTAATLQVRAATQEAEVADAVKQTWVNASEEDTVIDPAFDGINCRVLRNKAAEDLLQKKAFPLFDAISAGLHMKKTLNMSWGEFLRTANNMRKQPSGVGGGRRGLSSSMRFAVGSRLFRVALTDPVNGILMMGQTAGRIKDIPTVADVIERTVKEAEEIQKTMTKQFAN